MENFKYLDSKTIELAGISASVAGGCLQCLNYHYKKALDLGCSIEEAGEAIELGKMIKQKPVSEIIERADKLLQNSLKNQLNYVK